MRRLIDWLIGWPERVGVLARRVLALRRRLGPRTTGRSPGPAPPRWPPSSFLPAATTLPACEAAVQTLPTTPLTSPPSVQRAPAGLAAEALWGVAQAITDATAAARTEVRRRRVTWRSSPGAGRS